MIITRARFAGGISTGIEAVAYLLFLLEFRFRTNPPSRSASQHPGTDLPYGEIGSAVGKAFSLVASSSLSLPCI